MRAAAWPPPTTQVIDQALHAMTNGIDRTVFPMNFSCHSLRLPDFADGGEQSSRCVADDLVVCWAGINILAGATLGGGTRINWCGPARTFDASQRCES